MLKTYKTHKWTVNFCARCAMIRRREVTMGGTLAWAYKGDTDLHWRTRSGVCRVVTSAPVGH